MIMDAVFLDKSALEAVDDYWEYRRIVGEDDGGNLFSPEEYKEYKRKVLPLRMKNRYKQHQTDWEVVPSERPLALPCKVRGCHCSTYTYIPRLGFSLLRCRCKHLPEDHSEATGHLCKKCDSCSGFHSPYTCGCGRPCFEHRTLVETKLERQERGQPVGRDVPYAAMGGLTGFSSLLDGYLSLESSSTDEGREDGCLQRSSAARERHASLPGATGCCVRKKQADKH